MVSCLLPRLFVPLGKQRRFPKGTTNNIGSPTGCRPSIVPTTPRSTSLRCNRNGSTLGHGRRFPWTTGLPRGRTTVTLGRTAVPQGRTYPGEPRVLVCLSPLWFCKGTLGLCRPEGGRPRGFVVVLSPGGAETQGFLRSFSM